MNRVSSAIRHSADLLVAGEQIRAVSFAAVGHVSKKRQVASAVVTASLTLGTYAGYSVPVQRCLILTDRRLMFFEVNELTGRSTGELMAHISNAVISIYAVKRTLLKTQVDLVINGEDPQQLVLSFGRAVSSAPAFIRELESVFPVIP